MFKRLNENIFEYCKGNERTVHEIADHFKIGLNNARKRVSKMVRNTPLHQHKDGRVYASLIENYSDGAPHWFG